jgi:hypothetical protein
MFLIFGPLFGSILPLFLLMRSLIPPEGPSFAALSAILIGFVAAMLLPAKFFDWWAVRWEFARTVMWPERVLSVRVQSVEPSGFGGIVILDIVAGEKEGHLYVNARTGKLREALELAGQTVIEPNPA